MKNRSGSNAQGRIRTSATGRTWIWGIRYTPVFYNLSTVLRLQSGPVTFAVCPLNPTNPRERRRPLSARAGTPTCCYRRQQEYVTSHTFDRHTNRSYAIVHRVSNEFPATSTMLVLFPPLSAAEARERALGLEVGERLRLRPRNNSDWTL